MPVLAFPSAEGFGAEETVHGRGGYVTFVTNLNDSGGGSLRAAIEAGGARYVVFLVGGTINLSSNISIANPYIYIAGQSAPGGGILLRNYQIVIRTHDVVIRYIRGRCGLAAVSIPPGRDTNNFLIYGGTGAKYNIILDHCDSSWASDQNGPDVYAWAYNITTQWCSIGEGMVTGHSNGVPHNKGCILGSEPWMNGASYPANPPQVLTLSFHHNFMHSLGDRCPLISIYPRNGAFPTTAPCLLADIRNNVISNWGGNNATKVNAIFYNQSDHNSWTAGANGNAAVHANLVGNHYLNGPNTAGNKTICWVNPQVKVYAENNIGPNNPGVPVDGFAAFISRFNNRWIGDPISPATSLYGTYDPVAAGNLAGSSFFTPPVTTVDATLVKDLVLGNAGCTVPRRDSVLARWIAEANAGTGNGSINHSDYDTLEAGTAPTRSQSDGIADDWKTANGYDVGTDYTGVTDGNGYDVVENYLNSLAGDDVPGFVPGVGFSPRYRRPIFAVSLRLL